VFFNPSLPGKTSGGFAQSLSLDSAIRWHAGINSKHKFVDTTQRIMKRRCSTLIGQRKRRHRIARANLDAAWAFKPPNHCLLALSFVFQIIQGIHAIGEVDADHVNLPLGKQRRNIAFRVIRKFNRAAHTLRGID